MARQRTRLDEWLAEQDEREAELDGELVMRALTVAVVTSAVIYLGGHVVAALVR